MDCKQVDSIFVLFIESQFIQKKVFSFNQVGWNNRKHPDLHHCNQLRLKFKYFDIIYESFKTMDHIWSQSLSIKWMEYSMECCYMIYRFNLEFNPMSLSNSATLFITVDLMNIIINVTSLNNDLKRLDHTGHTFV